MESTLHDIQQTADFREALRSFLRRSEQVSRKHGLTPQRHLLLLMVKGAPDGSQRATVGELVRRLHLNQSTVTELVARAEDAGLLSRERSKEDGRVYYLSLTPEAEKRLMAVHSELAEGRASLRKVLGDTAD